MIMPDSPYFDIEELVCPHVYNVYKQLAWQFLDRRFVITINVIREKIGKSIMINNWKDGGKYSQRGMRCIQCEIVQDYIKKGSLYLSGHLLAKAGDMNVLGLHAEEVRVWLKKHQSWWPYPFRLEKDVDWVHLDTFDNGMGKIYEFNK
jgi:hypothetical protein